MINLSQDGDHDIVHQTTTYKATPGLQQLMMVNPRVNVADHTNSNPGVIVANQSVLYNQQPGVKFYNDTFENAGTKYYEAVLQNPGV